MSNQQIIKNLQNEIEYLSYDRAFGILTRQALELQCKEINTHVSIIALDFNNIHDLNLKFGYLDVNNRIKAVFASLKQFYSAIFWVGRLFSGDEIVLVVKKEGEEQLPKCLISECFQRGLSFKYIQEGLDNGFSKFDSIELISDYFDGLSARLQSNVEFFEIK